jgi:hypothetical protein
MNNDRALKTVQRALMAFDKGMLTEAETIARLGWALGDEELGDILAEIPEEKHSLVRAGYDAALQQVVDGDCLEPEYSPYDRIFGEEELYLAKTLLESDDRDLPPPRFFVLCVPSHQPCWALRFLRLGKTCPKVLRPTLVLIQADRTSKVRTRWSVAVPDELATRLIFLWETMLKTTRAHRHPRGGLDGVDYHFAAGRLAGRTWSPTPESRVGRFASFAHSLARYVAAPTKDRPALEDALRTELVWFKV